jgi:hypothetical protein
VNSTTQPVYFTPSASLNSYSVCVGGSVAITPTVNTAFGDSYTYTWTPSSGLSSTNTSTTTASPTTTTGYTFTLTSNHGCSGSATTTVTVFSYPTPTVNSATLFIGGTATLTATGGTTYSWLPASNLDATTGTPVHANPTTTTIYTVTASNYTCSSTATSTVTVIPDTVPVGTPGSCYCVSSFAPYPGKTYLVSAWASEDGALPTKTSFTYPAIYFDFAKSNSSYLSTAGPFTPSGSIIDGWQRIEGSFTVPDSAHFMIVRLQSGSGSVLFDDIRIFPFDGSAKSYVYDPVTLRLVSELDERNYATKYEYDEEGKLTRIKKETERGIMTVKESRSSSPKKQP